MTYFEAESMRMEMIVALQYDNLDKDRYKEVAKKYTAQQWQECGAAIIEKLEEDKERLYGLLALVAGARKEKI
jgi:hypothetical protein